MSAVFAPTRRALCACVVLLVVLPARAYGQTGSLERDRASITPNVGMYIPMGSLVVDPAVRLRPVAAVALGGARHAARFPATHRLDLDASREFTIGGASVAPYISVVNAYNAPNVFVYLYDYSTDAPTRRAISQFPVLPSLGVRVVF